MLINSQTQKMIYNEYRFLRKDQGPDQGVQKEHGHSRHHANANHILHCFDFLSQSLLCAGDLTIEPARVESDGRRIQVDGWGISHQCKDLDAILSWVEANHGPLIPAFSLTHPDGNMPSASAGVT